MEIYRRFVLLLGEAVMILGLLWFGMTLLSRHKFLPDGWNQPISAVLLALLGSAVIWITNRSGPRRIETEDAAVVHSENDPGIPTPEWIAQSNAETAAAEREAMGAAWERPQTRARLRVALPPERTNSWIGGLPHLPDTTDWPEMNDRPAAFLAQIALSDLPETVFRGLGPRHASLVFFTDSEALDCKVILVEGQLAERRPTQPTTLPLLWSEAFEQLEPYLGTAIYDRPRWYLKLADPDTQGSGQQDEEASQMNDSVLTKRQVFHKEFKSAEPRFHPFNWPSALLLLDQIAEKLAQFATSKTWLEKYETEDEKVRMRDRLDTRRKQFDDISRQFWALAPEMPYDREVHETLIESLCALPVTENTDAPSHAWGLLVFGQGRDHAHAFEALARRAYSDDPDSLPPETRAAFEPMWHEDAEQETIYIGSMDDGAVFLQRDDLLIDLPTSHLTGVHFGDMSRWWVTNPPLDLMRGRTDSAVADNSHGGF